VKSEVVAVELSNPTDKLDGGVELYHGERRTLSLQLQAPFRPFSLVLWGAKADCKIRNFIVADDHQLLTTLPGCLFESELSWAEFESLLHPIGDPLAGYRAIDARLIRQLGLIFRIDLPTVEVGSPIHLDVEGAFEHAVLLGDMLTEGLDARPSSLLSEGNEAHP
jgi:hypothetical protein